MYNLKQTVPVNVLSGSLSDKLAAMGYTVTPMMASDTMSTLNVTKSGSDLEKFAGMLPECNITLSRNGEQIYVNYEDVWTSKILALAIGWILCMIPFITGLIGVSRQSSMANEVQTMLMATVNELNV